MHPDWASAPRRTAGPRRIPVRRFQRPRTDFARTTLEGASIPQRFNPVQHLPPVRNQRADIQMPRMPQGNRGPSDRA